MIPLSPAAEHQLNELTRYYAERERDTAIDSLVDSVERASVRYLADQGLSISDIFTARYNAPMNAESSRPPLTLRRLAAADAASYRELRLEGLRDHPEAFGSSWEEEISRPLAWFAERLEHNAVFGGSSPASPALAGVVSLLVPEAAKLRHKGVLWGMFVRPEAQGTGLGTALLARVIEHAAPVLEEVRLTVVTSNTAAVHLYTRAGFEPYGLERRALKLGDTYYDELLMARLLNRTS